MAGRERHRSVFVMDTFSTQRERERERERERRATVRESESVDHQER